MTKRVAQVKEAVEVDRTGRPAAFLDTRVVRQTRATRPAVLQEVWSDLICSLEGGSSKPPQLSQLKTRQELHSASE